MAAITSTREDGINRFFPSLAGLFNLLFNKFFLLDQ
jgi:hypothetical protein